MAIDNLIKRKPNLFENILLFIGIFAIGTGYYFVHFVIIEHGLYSFESTTVLMLWFALIVLIILTAVNENSKEELKIIIKQQHEEIKLLRADLRRKI